MAIVIGGGSGNAISINSSVGSAGQVIVSDGTNSSWGSVSGDGFVSGTLMLFQQTTAPTGWTKQTTHDNKALRVVSGTCVNGGTTAFTSVFTSRTPAGTNSGGSVSAHTLSISEIPSHTHQVSEYNAVSPYGNTPYSGVSVLWTNTNNTYGLALYSFGAGGGGAHSHGFINPTFNGTAMDFAVQYVDLIIASKN